MIYCLCSDTQTSAASSSSEDVVGKASGLQKDIDGVSQTASHLNVSFFALLAWMMLVTVALLTVFVLGCRQWRRQRRRDADWEDGDDSYRSTSDASSVCSRPTTQESAVACRRDRTVLEGVESGRGASSQASVDNTINSLSASVAEPWHVQNDTKNQWSSARCQQSAADKVIAVQVQPCFVKYTVLFNVMCHNVCVANVVCDRVHWSNVLHCS